MENKSQNSHRASIEFTIRFEAQNVSLRIGTLTSWLALIFVTALKVTLYLIKSTH